MVIVQIENPGFETGDLSGWSADSGWYLNNVSPKSGTYKALTAIGSTEKVLRSNTVIPVAPEATVAFSVAHYATGTHRVELLSNTGETLAQSFTGADGWRVVDCEFKIPGGWSSCQVQVVAGMSGDYLRVDDVARGGVLVVAVKARDDVTLAALTDVANVRRYYLLQSSTLNPPAAPTANPAPAPWVTAEPTYTEGSTTSLYTVDLTVFTDGTFDYSTVSKSSSYEAAKSAFNKAVAATNTANAALAAVPPFVQQATPSATVVGQLWFPLDASGRMIGMKRASKTGTSGWVDYLWMAGRILVPGSVGTTEIGPDGVLAANIKASNELSAKIASFLKVTTDMLIAGNATITNELLVDTLIGKILRGGMVVAGDGANMPTALLGPASGNLDQPGDRFGLYLNTPGNVGGTAFLEVTPEGPAMSFFDSTNNPVLSADKNGVRVPNRTSGGMVDLSLLVANALSYTISNTFTLQFPPSQAGTTPWSQPSFFRNPWSSLKIGSVGKVSSPTGKILFYGGCTIDAPATDQIGIELQWNLHTQDPSNYAWDETGKNVYGLSLAPSRSSVGGVGMSTVGMIVANVEPNVEYWVAPIYWTYNLSSSTLTRTITRLWMYATPTV